MITEDQLEHLCLDWFKSIGYDTICGYDIAPDKVNGEAREGALGYGDSPERTGYGQVVLFNRLLTQLQTINTHISDLFTFNQTALETYQPHG